MAKLLNSINAHRLSEIHSTHERKQKCQQTDNVRRLFVITVSALFAELLPVGSVRGENGDEEIWKLFWGVDWVLEANFFWEACLNVDLMAISRAIKRMRVTHKSYHCKDTAEICVYMLSKLRTRDKTCISLSFSATMLVLASWVYANNLKKEEHFESQSTLKSSTVLKEMSQSGQNLQAVHVCRESRFQLLRVQDFFRMFRVNANISTEIKLFMCVHHKSSIVKLASSEMELLTLLKKLFLVKFKYVSWQSGLSSFSSFYFAGKHSWMWIRNLHTHIWQSNFVVDFVVMKSFGHTLFSISSAYNLQHFPFQWMSA